MVKSDKNAKNSVAEGIYGEFKVRKIRRLIRRAVFFRRIFGGQISGGEFGGRRRLRGLGCVKSACAYDVSARGLDGKMYLLT